MHGAARAVPGGRGSTYTWPASDMALGDVLACSEETTGMDSTK